MSGDKVGEGFYEMNGERHDADIHRDILAGVDDTKFRTESAMALIKLGLQPDVAARVYGLEGGFELGGGSLAPESG